MSECWTHSVMRLAVKCSQVWDIINRIFIQVACWGKHSSSAWISSAANIKMKKKKMAAEVIKLIVKPAVKELWGAKSHVGFFFSGVFLLLLSFKWFQRLFKGKISAVPELRSKSEQLCGICFTWSSLPSLPGLRSPASKPAAHRGINLYHEWCCVSLCPYSCLGQKQRLWIYICFGHDSFKGSWKQVYCLLCFWIRYPKSSSDLLLLRALQ